MWIIVFLSCTGEGTSSNVWSRWWTLRLYSAHCLNVKKSILDSILAAPDAELSLSITFKLCSIQSLSIGSPGPLQNFLKLKTEVSRSILNSSLLRNPSRSVSKRSKIKRIFSLFELRQIIDKPQQNSLKSMNPERSRSNNLKADSATC